MRVFIVSSHSITERSELQNDTRHVVLRKKLLEGFERDLVETLEAMLYQASNRPELVACIQTVIAEPGIWHTGYHQTLELAQAQRVLKGESISFHLIQGERVWPVGSPHLANVFKAYDAYPEAAKRTMLSSWLWSEIKSGFERNRARIARQNLELDVQKQALLDQYNLYKPVND